MTKARPNMSIDGEVWENFKAAVSNASEEVEDFMAGKLSEMGLDTKSTRAIKKAKDAERKREEKKAEKREAEIGKAYARGQFVWTEDMPRMIPTSRLFTNAPAHRPGR